MAIAEAVSSEATMFDSECAVDAKERSLGIEDNGERGLAGYDWEWQPV